MYPCDKNITMYALFDIFMKKINLRIKLCYLSFCCYRIDIIDYKCIYKMPMKVGLVGPPVRVWV